MGDARQKKEPIESVLIHDIKIPKKEVGKSLSQFYKVPFEEYNKMAPIPGELLSGLKVQFLRSNVWVPLRKEDDKIIIAVDNPYDLQKVDGIRALFMGKTVAFCVALKEDILEYINLFTQDEKELASMDDILSQLHMEDREIEEAEASLGEEDSAVVQLVNK
ncbi:pilus assembly protein, partial [Desulfobacteraceae bacterium SEEP-SAG9]